MGLFPELIYKMRDFATRLPVYFDSYEVTCTQLILDTSAVFSVKLFANNMPFCLLLQFVMSGEDYKGWKNDDEYVYEWIQQKIQEMQRLSSQGSAETAFANISQEAI